MKMLTFDCLILFQICGFLGYCFLFETLENTSDIVQFLKHMFHLICVCQISCSLELVVKRGRLGVDFLQSLVWD